MSHELEAALRPLLPHDVGALQLLADGHNIVFRAGDDLVVRVQPVERMSEQTAHALVEHLVALGDEPELRVPRPVRLASGSWVEEIRGADRDYRVSLVTWVEGERAPDAKSFVEQERLRTVGASVARMHALSSSETRVQPLSAETLFGPQSGLQMDAFRDEVRDAPWNAAVARMSAALDAPSGIIHADLEPQNWVFDNGRPGVIDFDELRHGPFAFDLLGVLWTHAMWDDYPRFREDLFAGYESVRPLPDRTREDADVIAAALFANWFDFIYRELSADEQARHQKWVRPMLERILNWCDA